MSAPRFGSVSDRLLMSSHPLCGTQLTSFVLTYLRHPYCTDSSAVSHLFSSGCIPRFFRSSSVSFPPGLVWSRPLTHLIPLLSSLFHCLRSPVRLSALAFFPSFISHGSFLSRLIPRLLGSALTFATVQASGEGQTRRRARLVELTTFPLSLPSPAELAHPSQPFTAL